MFEESVQIDEEKLGLEKNSVAKFKGHKEEVQLTTYSDENCDDENLFRQEFTNLKINDNIDDDETNKRHETDLDEELQPLCERWSPLGADYDDDVVSRTSDIMLCSDNNGKLYYTESQETLNSKLEAEVEADGMRFRNMEEEQELLTTSLLALTSHFAHVQLRVRQIVEAPAQERDQLLKDLEEFAFRGVPEMVVITPKDNSEDNVDKVEITAPNNQYQLIQHLKSQLSELEKLAYEAGAPVLPQHMLLEKQKIIIDELKCKLNLRVEETDLPKLTTEQLKWQVDNALGELMGPLKMRDQLVAQLKTQITDLERFIAFLQHDGKLGNTEKFSGVYNSYAAKSKIIRDSDAITAAGLTKSCTIMAASRNVVNQEKEEEEANLNSKAHGLLNKASVLMHIFASTHLPLNAANQFQKNTLKKTTKGNHWGDLRAQLEVDIQEVAALAATLSIDREKLFNIQGAHKNRKRPEDNAKVISSEKSLMKKTTLNLYKPQEEIKTIHCIQSDSDEDELTMFDWDANRSRAIPHHMRNYAGDSIVSVSKELTTAVRKNFCITLQLLMEHGLHVQSDSMASNLIVPFMNCFNPSANLTYGGNGSGYAEDEQQTHTKMHAWEFLMEYYCYKNGHEYNNTPARRLMQSFNLDNAEVQNAIPAKESLLRAIGMIDALHRPYKRSYNAYFKAFICEGLNSHKLVEWLNIIFSCSKLIERFYVESSYVVRTGFRDSLRSIDILMKYDFNLPVDIAVRHLRNC